MTFLAFLACSTLIFFAYHSQEAANPASADTSQSSQDTTTRSFIQTIGESVRQIAAQNDLYASVMIAQAILESNSGQSKLSQAPNYNFFGIKGDYKGQSVTMQTWEDEGNGNSYTIDAQFRSMVVWKNPCRIMFSFFKKICMLVCINQRLLLIKMRPQH